MRDVLKKPDYILLAATAAILGLGILTLSSATSYLSQVKYHDSYYLLKHQLLMGILPGIVLGFIAFRIPIEWVRKSAPILMVAVLALLALVFMPGMGMSVHGARRWIHFGFATVQPSEILKLIFIVYLASWLSSHSFKFAQKGRGRGRSLTTLLPFLIVLCLVGTLVILQPDMSTFGIVAVSAVIMYFSAGAPLRHLFFIGALGIIAVLALVYFEPYRMSRFTSWMLPETDPMGRGFQANQALIIASSGGIFGQGFGSISSKYALLPELIGDSIFAPYAAETGFIGCSILIALFMVIAWRSFLIAFRSADSFCRLIAMGIAIWFVFQTALNIASTLRLIPLSGVPLTLVSYGGTAMIVELVAVGLLLNLSRRKE